MSQEHWLDERDGRAQATGRPGFRMASGSSESFTYVDGEILFTNDAVEVLHIRHDPHYTLVALDESALIEHQVVVYRWEDPTGPALPQKIAELRDLARTRDPAGDVDVALHYVFAGEKIGTDKTTIPRGAPAGPPAAAAAVGEPQLGEGRPVIAVVDTGIDTGSTTGRTGRVVAETLGDLDVDMLVAPVPLGQPSVLGAEAGHGTFITWLVDRMAGGSVAVADLKALDPDGLGTEHALVTALSRLRGSRFREDHGFDDGQTVAVVNLSLGGFTDDQDHVPPIEKDAMPLLLGRELAAWRSQFPQSVIVAAAGNDGQTNRKFWPAAAAGSHPEVIAVGSLDAHGHPSSFSNQGEWVTISTIGEGIHSDYPTGDYQLGDGQVLSLSGGATWSGTSFATPIVAAEIARRVVALAMTGDEAWHNMCGDVTTDPSIPGRGFVWTPTVDPTA
jgi:hypothetical protein